MEPQSTELETVEGVSPEDAHTVDGVTPTGAEGDNVGHEAAVTESHGEAGGHGEGSEGGHGGGHEVPHALPLIASVLEKKGYHGAAKVIEVTENSLYSGLMVVVVALVVMRGLRKRLMIPGQLQNAIEFIIESFDDLICGILGKEHGRRFLPFLGSLFLFIILNNYMGMVPGLKAPTSVPQTTFALSICVFLYVQFVGIQMNGPLGYIYHLMGSPKSVVEWALMPLMFPLHVFGELIKPVSLALRLMGNIMGEDILIFVCAMLGTSAAMAIGLSNVYVGLPFQLPVFFLSLLLGAIQALVFTLLSAIYFMMMLPHEEH
ncbi:F0F1 ATP synthase subunit A [Candidatus Sumerlaeota bacterium]